MMKKKSRSLLSLLLSLMMVLTLIATPVYAAETGDTTTETTVEESTNEITDTTEETPDVVVDENEESEEAEELLTDTLEEAEDASTDTSEEEAEDVSEDGEALSAEDVQSMIDALPEASEITSENASEVEAQLDAIDAARAEIGEAADDLDYTKYDAACAALEAVYAAEASENEDFDEFVPDVELPNGASRSDRIVATSVASAVEDTETANVVSIDGDTTNTYSTVTDAIDAIDSTGTITLTGDLSEESITIPSGKDITLNLNGYTLTLTGCTTYTDTGYTGSTFRALLVNQGTLTVQGGTLLGNGTYTTDNTTYYVNNMILNAGTLNINSGVTVTGKLYTITNVGGTVTTAGDITATYYDAIVTYGGAITVDGGTITATNSTYYGSAIDIFGRNYSADRDTETNKYGANVTINGGTINAYCYDFSTNNLYSGDSCLNIYGGTINSVFACIYWPTPGTITIGSTTSTSDATPYLTNTGGSGIVICCGTLNVYSGTIEATYAATASTPFDSTTWAANYRASSGMTGLADAISIIANRSTNYAQYALEVNLEGGTFISASNYAVRYANCNAASNSDSTDTEQTISVELSGGTYTGGTTTDGSTVAAIDTCEYEDTTGISTLTVTGGTYSSDVSSYIADTAAVIETEDGYTVISGDEDDVAVVYGADGSYIFYDTLKAASAALTDGDTVVLIADSYDSPFTLSKEIAVTLDLNGYSINMSSSASYPRTPVTVSAGELTVKDSSADETGEIAAGSSSSQGAIYITGGTLTVENGTFKAARTYTGAIISQGTAAKVVINGGTFIGNTYALRVYTGEITIEGGYFYAAQGEGITVATAGGTTETTTAGTSGGCIRVDISTETEDRAVVINGGYFKCGTSSATSTSDTTVQPITVVVTSSGIENTESGITIYGGAFSSNRYSSVSAYLASGKAISFDAEADDTYPFSVGDANYTIGYYDSETFVTSDGSTSISDAITKAAAITDSEAGITGVVVMNVESYTGKTISIPADTAAIILDLNGCQIATSGIAIAVGVGADLTIIDSKDSATVTNSADANGQAGVVRNYGGCLTIKGGTYTQAATGSYTFVVYMAGELGDDSAVATTIEGGTFVSETGYAFGAMFGTLTVTDAYVNADTLVNKSTHGVSITGGYYKNDPSSYVAEECSAYDYSDETYNYFVDQAGYVARIGSTFYESLSDAITAANEAAEAVTLTLLADATLGSTAEFTNEDAAVTLDLNGKTISYTVSETGVKGAIKNTGTLTVTDGSTDKTGKISVDATLANGNSACGIINSGNLTLEGGTIEVTTTVNRYLAGVYQYAAGATVTLDGADIVVSRNTDDTSTTSYAVYGIYSGSQDDIVIKSGTITASNTYAIAYGTYQTKSTSSLEMSGGEINVSGASTKYGLRSSGSITVTGGTITVESGTASVYGIYASSSKYANVSSVTVSVSTGDTTGSYKAYPTDYATITSGTFSGDALYNTTATGGMFDFDPVGFYQPYVYMTTTSTDDSGVTWYTIVDYSGSDENAVNTNTNETYASLQTAIDKASDGDTIKLLNDWNAQGFQIVIDKGITLDLNGNTISSPDVAVGNILAISGGTSDNPVVITDSAAASHEDAGTIITRTGIAVSSGYATIEKINIETEVFNGAPVAILSNGDANITLTGLNITVESTSTGSYTYVEAVNVTGSGATITLQDYNDAFPMNVSVKSATGYVEIFKIGGKNTVTVESGTYEVTSTKTSGSAALYVSFSNSTGSSYAGVTISGGYFKLNDTEGVTLTKAVGRSLTVASTSGGYYNFDPSDNVTDGYSVVALTEGDAYDAGYTYQVTDAVVASVNGIGYATLQAAITAAEGTEYPVVLLGDITVNATVTMDSTVSFEMGSYSITFNGTPGFCVKDGVDLPDAFANYFEASAVSTSGTYAGYTAYYTSFVTALSKADSGSTITLLKDVSVDSVITISKTLTIDFGENTLTSSADNSTSFYSAIQLAGGTLTLTGTTGGITAENGYVINVTQLGITGSNYGTLVVNGGCYIADSTCVQVEYGSATINGGTFDAGGSPYTVNCIDAQYQSGTATISVTGGEFVEFDPSNCSAEGAGTSFVAEGYQAIPTTDAGGTTTYIVMNIKLGVSDNENAAVDVISIANYGESIIYVGVSATNISSYYDTDSYPTTSLTYTPANGDSGSYIFAGWYSASTETDDDGNTSTVYTAMTEFPEDTDAYAKFVEANVLGIECIFTPSSKTGGAGNVWRFFTSWDAKAYNVFFTVDGGQNNVESSSVRYYTKYTVTSSNVEINPEDFSSISTHILTGYYASASATSCTVTACWTTQDGTTVYGSTATYGTSDGGLLTPTSTD